MPYKNTLFLANMESLKDLKLNSVSLFHGLMHIGLPHQSANKDLKFSNPRWQTGAILEIIKCDISTTI